MTASSELNATPSPTLRIVPTASLYPHEIHDSQRSKPLIERILNGDVMINPPIVALMDNGQYAVLDGANRTSAFNHLNYPHILVQVVDYDSPFVKLETWQHVVCAWQSQAFIEHMQNTPEITLSETPHENALATVQFRDDHPTLTIIADGDTATRNHALNRFVAIYQRNATLHRTALDHAHQVWDHHTDSIALVKFPAYRPTDVIAAVKENAHIPPGITRHIIQGRALKINYPLKNLIDSTKSLEEKNQALSEWFNEKVNNRHVRYYAESTYQFDE